MSQSNIHDSLTDMTALIMQISGIEKEFIDGGKVLVEIDFENHELTRFLFALFESENYDLLASGLIVLAAIRADLPKRIIAHFLKAMIIRSASNIDNNYEIKKKLIRMNIEFERLLENVSKNSRSST